MMHPTTANIANIPDATGAADPGAGNASAGAVGLLHDLFDAIALRYPERIAVEVPPGDFRPRRVRITYAQLRERADSIAARLSPMVRPDAVVAVLLPRDSPDLYAAQLAVLKAGGAFTCIDPKFPDEHLAGVIEDARAVALITDPPGRRRVESVCSAIPPVIDPCDVATAPAGVNLARPEAFHLAYIIYTSGTTGKPKGVMIEHRSIMNLIQGDIDYFRLTCAERVAQCSSPAYDSSIEEAWLAFAVGATLVPLDDHTVRLGPDLVPWLARERITVLCPPPTLLRTTGCSDPQRQLPDLKLLYVGGEALPADLADRWAAGRWMENGYGPTECTVTVVRGRVRTGEAVTIGTPVRGSQAWVLDSALREVPEGESGELCISGASLARGYHGREDLTLEKFPIHPKLGRIYRTGDLVRRNPHGDLEYLGRIDAQVKLRGYRIELGGIEAVLAGCAGVRDVACKVQGEGAGQILVAHIVPAQQNALPSVKALKESLRRSLPDYMVPARFAFLDHLPTTVGGKLDRRALPDVEAGARKAHREIVPPRTDEETRIAAAFKKALSLSEDVSIHDDFFLDLGGDSLSAVGVICELRAAGEPSAAAISRATVRDLYEARTAAQLAARSNIQEATAATDNRSVRDRPRGRPGLSTAIQCLWIAVELVGAGALAAALPRVLLPFLLRHVGLTGGALLAPLLAILGILIYAPLSVAGVALLKRIVIGRYKPIRTPVWGNFYTRHWIVTSAARLIPWSFLEGTFLFPVALRVLGAKVGRRVHVHRGVDLRRGGWDLLTIGDDVTLSQDAAPRLVELEDGQLVVGPITIGDGATLDVRAGMSPGSAVGRNGYVAPLSWLRAGATVAEGQSWDGVPARATGTSPSVPQTTRGGELSPVLHGILLLLGRSFQFLGGAILVVLAAILAPVLFPDAGARVLSWVEAPGVSMSGLGMACALGALGLAGALTLSAVAARAMGRVQPGVVSQWSLEALRIWTKTGMVDSASRWLSGSIFWPWWLRLAGMHVGRGCEISTIIDVIPETVRIGRESFFADGIYFCAPWRHRGTITIARSRLGRGTFLGNHAVVPGGYCWPDGLFVGVSTVADARRATPGSSWFGHPPMELPRRQIVTADRRLTHDPGLLRYSTRVFWELMRFALPALPIGLACAWYVLITMAGACVGEVMLLSVVAPLLSLAAGLASGLAVIVLKWMLLGRVRPGQHAFWSCWCGRWDFLYMAWGYWARGVLAVLDGTLLLNGFLRLTGVRIGRRVVLGPGFTQVVDPDMFSFEDEATVNCHFQAHSFEDRILKLDYIHIGRGASVGEGGVVFYGVRIGEAALVDPHSVVMKRDVLDPGTRYQGCPTRPVKTTADVPITMEGC